MSIKVDEACSLNEQISVSPSIVLFTDYSQLKVHYLAFVLLSWPCTYTYIER